MTATRTWDPLICRPADPALPVAPSVFSVALRLSFCLNRWWEGRCLWEKLVYASINATQQARVWFEDEKLLNRFINIVIVFAWTCKAQLRGKRLEDEGEEGHPSISEAGKQLGLEPLVQRKLLEEKELAQFKQVEGWQPQYCIDIMRAVVHQELSSGEGEPNEGEPKRYNLTAKMSMIESSVNGLSKAMSGSIRVKSTGLPQMYDVGLKALLMLYCVVCNLAYAQSLGWYTPIMAFSIYFILWALITMGSVLVNPFGVDPVDHDLGSYCSLIEAQCKAVQGRQREELHLPPSQRKEES